jgi:GGDEF domain-containing protein
LVAEELRRVVANPELAMIAIVIDGMDAFSEAYGFVTHDDVLRAVALILRNTATESVGTKLFVGQLDLYQYLLVAPAGQSAYVTMGRLDQRLHEAISFFYPHRDWERGQRADGSDIPKLTFEIQLVDTDGIACSGDLDDLRAALASPLP